MRWILIISILFFRCVGFGQKTTWEAPKASNTLVNPIPVSDTTLIFGKEIYKHHCASCHGIRGRGDGIGGTTLNKSPADFRKSSLVEQSDGNLYWKIVTGKPPMRSYNHVLDDEAIWSVIHYIKLLSLDKKK